MKIIKSYLVEAESNIRKTKFTGILEQYSSDDLLISRMWFQDGIEHRLDGPAIIWYKSNNMESDYQYWINGQIIHWDYDITQPTPEKYIKAVKDYKLLQDFKIIKNIKDINI